MNTGEENDITQKQSGGVKITFWKVTKWINGRLIWFGTHKSLVMLLLSIGVTLLLVYRILFSSVEIGTPATESEALVRSSERLLQMVQWTISTVLIIGGGLIGLNWYSNEHRYRDDRAKLDERLERSEKARLAEFTSSIAERLALQEQLLEVKLDVYRMTDQLTNMMLYPDGQMPSGGYVRATIELLRKPGNSDLIKKRALEGIATLFRSADSATSFTVFLGLDSIPELADEAEKQGFSDLATGLRKRYQELKNMDSEEP